MRLDERQQTVIRDQVQRLMPPGIRHELWVFGSRLDDRSRGGDVDVYLEVQGLAVAERERLRRRLRLALEEALDLPVDLVVQDSEAPLMLVSRIAKREGVRL